MFLIEESIAEQFEMWYDATENFKDTPLQEKENKRWDTNRIS
jgi:hypothetical protein